MINKVSVYFLALVIACSVCSAARASMVVKLFEQQKLSVNDAVLVTSSQGEELYSWQADKLLVPASLAKLATAHLAIETWGLDKRFETHFYRNENTLWEKGFGDPYLVSEEIELIALALMALDINWVTEIAIDGSYFKGQSVPGRSKVADPYNAPLAAVSANFNTAQLRNVGGRLHSAEPTTKFCTSISRQAR